MLIKIITSSDIDRDKWQNLVATTENSLFLSDWYLDTVATGWGAVVWGDYESAFPLTTICKAGQQQVIQPIFTREFKVLGKRISQNELLKLLSDSFKNVNLRFGQCVVDIPSRKRSHQLLDLGLGVEGNYSTNAKRLIKKADKHFSYRISTNLKPFFTLINNSLAPKIDEFNVRNLNKLQALMKSAIEKDKGQCIAIFDESDQFVGAGFFFMNQNRITYLKGAATDLAKKNGAMYGLLNFAIQSFSNHFQLLDFGGSEIENVANFYKKFGAKDRFYYHYEINRLPKWYKLLKKIKK